MGRSTKFISGLAFGYVTIAINVGYTLASIPIALHYLSKEEFGLWALITQITAYLMLLEFGLSGSVARFLADHKDHVHEENYGKIIRTGHWIFSIQGLIITLLAAGLSLPLASFMKIPEDLQNTFAILLTIQTIFAALHLSTRTHGSILWSHQRHDIINIASSLGLVMQFAVLWGGLAIGWKLNSLAFASFVNILVSLGITIFANTRLGYYPPINKKNEKFDSAIFRQLFHFGSGLFVINIGNQLASASQVVIISRIMGLEAASTWSVATKASSLSQTLVGRILDSSTPALTEMSVRGEEERLKKRFTDIVMITTAVAIGAMAGITLLNESMLKLWTSSKIFWDTLNNPLLGILILVTSVTRCYVAIAIIKRRITLIKYASLFEGVGFVVSSCYLVSHFGFPGLLVAAIASNLLFTGFYSIQFAYRQLHIPPLFTGRRWFQFILIAGVITITSFTLHTPAIHNLDPISYLLIATGALIGVIAPAVWHFAFDRDTRIEIVSRVSGLLRR